VASALPLVGVNDDELRLLAAQQLALDQRVLKRQRRPL
jgi:hypothetical protein